MDVPAPQVPERAPHRRWGVIGLVALGGAIGTGIRAVLADALPAVDGISWTIFAINVVGAFCLGLLLETLAHRGADVGRRRTLRLFVGTGVLGGFTTYSTLADDTARLLDDGRWGAGSGHALLTVVAGLAAVGAGVLLAARLRPARPDDGGTAGGSTTRPAAGGDAPTGPDTPTDGGTP